MKKTLITVISIAFLVVVAVLTIRGQQNKQENILGGQTESNNKLNLKINNFNQKESSEEKIMPSTYSANRQLAKPEMTIDQSKNYLVTLNTSEGEIVIQLDVEQTPVTSNNFVYLIQNKFYDGTIFHRVIDGFMIQGGDPRGDGTGGPGYRFNDETITKEYLRGTVAMANSGPNTNGSQFFIMHADYPLPKNYVIFGQVINGLEAVDAIATAPVTSNFSGESSKPVKPVVINSASVEVK